MRTKNFVLCWKQKINSLEEDNRRLREKLKYMENKLYELGQSSSSSKKINFNVNC